MSKTKTAVDEDITLINSIRKISYQVSFHDSEPDMAHSQFLLEVIDDMEQQVKSRRNLRAKQLLS